jgi:hypothetical protein
MSCVLAGAGSMSMHLLVDHMAYFMRQQPRCSVARLSTDVFETKHKHSRLFRVSGELKNAMPTFYQLMLKSTAVVMHEVGSGGARIRSAVLSSVHRREARALTTVKRKDCMQLASAAVAAARTGSGWHVITVPADEVCTVDVQLQHQPPWAPVTRWKVGTDACPSTWGKQQSLVPPASLRCWGRSAVAGSCLGDVSAQGVVASASKVVCPAGSKLKRDAATITGRTGPHAADLIHLTGFACS